MTKGTVKDHGSLGIQVQLSREGVHYSYYFSAEDAVLVFEALRDWIAEVPHE